MRIPGGVRKELQECPHPNTSRQLTKRPRQLMLRRPSTAPRKGRDAEHVPHVPGAPGVTKSSLCVATTQFSCQWHGGASVVKTDPTHQPGSQKDIEGGGGEHVKGAEGAMIASLA